MAGLLRRASPRAVLGVTSLLLAIGALQLWRAGEVSLVLDAEIDRGKTVELFHNELWTESQRLPRQPGRQLYRFDGLPPKLWSLRLDPSDDRSAQIRIHGIRVTRGATTLRTFTPAEVAGWTAVNLVVTASAADVLELRSITDDPMLLAPGTLVFPTREILAGFLRAVGTEQLFGLGFLVFLLAGALPWRGVPALAAPVLLPSIALLSAIAQRTITRVVGVRLGGDLPPVEAVGQASWLGYPKLADFRIYALTVVLSAVLGLLGGLGLARLARPGNEPEESPPPPGRRWSAATVATVALLVVYAVVAFPDLSGRLEQLRHQTHRLAYDDGNFFVWAYFVHKGWKPFVDFWYPYGGYSHFGPGGWFPWGYLLAWAHELFLLCVAGWALLRLNRQQPSVAPLILAILLGGYLADVFARGDRYLLALDLALVLLVARRDGYPRRQLLFLAALGAYTFLLEPTQLVPAALPIPLFLLADLRERPTPLRRQLLRELLLALGVFVAGVILVLVLWAVRGQLGGLLEFLGQLGVMSIYGAMPGRFSEWYRFTGSESNLVLWPPLFLLALGAAAWAWSQRLTPLAAIAIGFGLLGVVPFNKFLIRPHLANQVICYSIVGLALVACHLLPRLRLAQRSILAALGAGLVWAALDAEPGARLGDRVRGLRALPANLAALRGDHRATELAYYEDENRYPEELDLIRRLKELTRPTAPGGAREKVFVLGDDSFLYAALAQRAPYYVTLYNASPLAAQERVQAWVEQEKPRWLVWRPEFQSFDGVPNAVRVPLLFRTAVSEYEPVERFGRFEILRRRAARAGEIDLAFWEQRLGEPLDLGALPALSPLSGFQPCTSGVDCIAALRVDVDRPVQGQRRRVAVRVGERRFEVSLTELANRRRYHIRLDRLWFWPAVAGGDGLEIEAGPGASAQRVSLSGRRSSLW